MYSSVRKLMREELKEGFQKDIKLLEDVHIFIILIVVIVSRVSKITKFCFVCSLFIIPQKSI